MSETESTADGLNRPQRTAVTTLSGPLLVLAGAGTGKTRVITYRIGELIKAGVPPQRILAVTFTNKAAKEMRERAMKLIGRKKRKKQKGPEISTFHSLCVRVLRRHATTLGYPEQFTIYDRGDQESIARGALRDIRVGSQKLRPSDLINQVSSWKGAGLTPAEAEDAATDDTQLLCALAYARYQAQLKASGAMDFDDLLLQTEVLFEKFPEARFAEASRFDHLLIDEYQDTNALQYRIVKALAERHRNLCVVGDDDQSIYGWRGAEVEHILGFKKQWPDAKVVRLEDNYRSTEWVIHLANQLIAHNKQRHDKVLKAARGRGDAPRFNRYDDENVEAESVVHEIFHRINREDNERTPASHIAILFRTNEQPRVFEQELRRHGVPYRLVGGQSFFDRKEIKDLLSYLRILANPLDEVSLLRVMNTPPRGIGTSSIQALLDEAVAAGDPLWKVLPVASAHPSVTENAARGIGEFIALIEEFRARLGQDLLGPLVAELVSRVNYRAEIEKQYKDPTEQDTRWNSVEELINSITSYEERDESPSLLGYLEESALNNKDDEDDSRQEHAVTLMTLHSAKGLEFPIVYLVGLEEGLLPHKRTVVDPDGVIDEERRLAYVGVTRAQDTLLLSFCRERMKWGKMRAQIPSRFLMEMRGETEKANELAAAGKDQLVKDQMAADALDGAKNKKKKRKAKAQPKAEQKLKKELKTASPKPPASQDKQVTQSRVRGQKAAAKKSASPTKTQEIPQEKISRDVAQTSINQESVAKTEATQLQTPAQAPQLIPPAQKHSEPAQKHSEPAQKHSEPAQKHSEPAQKHSEPAQKHSEPAQKHSEPAQKHSEPAQKHSEPAQKQKSTLETSQSPRRQDKSAAKLHAKGRPISETAIDPKSSQQRALSTPANSVTRQGASRPEGSSSPVKRTARVVSKVTSREQRREIPQRQLSLFGEEE